MLKTVLRLEERIFHNIKKSWKSLKRKKMALNIENNKTTLQNHKIHTIRMINIILKIGCSKYIFFYIFVGPKTPHNCKKNHLSACIIFHISYKKRSTLWHWPFSWTFDMESPLRVFLSCCVQRIPRPLWNVQPAHRSHLVARWNLGDLN